MKLIYYLLICRSLTSAHRMARVLSRVGIAAIVTTVPQTITTNGCGYCVKVLARNISNALITLKNAELYPVRVYLQNADNSFGEVSL